MNRLVSTAVNMDMVIIRAQINLLLNIRLFTNIIINFNISGRCIISYFIIAVVNINIIIIRAQINLVFKGRLVFSFHIIRFNISRR